MVVDCYLFFASDLLLRHRLHLNQNVLCRYSEADMDILFYVLYVRMDNFDQCPF